MWRSSPAGFRCTEALLCRALPPATRPEDREAQRLPADPEGTARSGDTRARSPPSNRPPQLGDRQTNTHKNPKAHGRQASCGRQNATSSRSARLYLHKVKQHAGRSPHVPAPLRRAAPYRGTEPSAPGAPRPRPPGGAATARGSWRDGAAAALRAGLTAARSGKGGTGKRRFPAASNNEKKKKKNANKRKHAKKEL